VPALDTVEFATSLLQEGLIASVKLALPILAVGLAVGVIVSVLQAVTQIQEQVLSFVPKILAMAVAVALLLPWILTVITQYAKEMFGRLSEAGLS
jgi:flagellar biosynthetic protein FliQ